MLVHGDCYLILVVRFVQQLGNSIPTTFKPSYPGYGSWTGATLNSDSYPPKNYPNSGQYS